MEALWEREVDHISSIKIPQLKNLLCYHYLYDKYKGQKKPFMVDIAKNKLMGGGRG